MKLGVVKEITIEEQRVSLTPSGVALLVNAGHEVVFQRGAGEGAGFGDEEYRKAGGQEVSREAAWAVDLVVKVKEPLAQEFPFFNGQIVFTYFHLAGVDPALTKALLEKNVTAVAYETVEDESGKLPLLAPMSAVAGNMATAMGNYYLAGFNDGKGMLLGSLLGKSYGKVIVIGDGVVGQHAARVATGMGAHCFIFGLHEEHEGALKAAISPKLNYVLSTAENIQSHIEDADLVIGAVLSPGARAPHIVTEAMVKSMQPGSVVVDVSIDQGGSIETSHPTSHTDPVYTKHDVIHYCVTNMPGAYPRTSTFALTNATLPYVRQLADEGIKALYREPLFGKGVNIHRGWLTNEPVAKALDLVQQFKSFQSFEDGLSS